MNFWLISGALFAIGAIDALFLYWLFDKKIIRGKPKPSMLLLTVFLVAMLVLFGPFGLAGSIAVLAWKLRYG